MKDSLFDVKVSEHLANPNPCVRLYGFHKGAKCKTWVHLYLQGGVSGRYYKCDLRKNTRGPGTDHRVRWDACGKYEWAI